MSSSFMTTYAPFELVSFPPSVLATSLFGGGTTAVFECAAGIGVKR